MLWYLSLRHGKRLRQILRTFARYGLPLLSRRIPLFERLRAFIPREALRRPPQENLRLAFEELGPTFIKIGQILSTRLDLLPEEYCRELRKLQDQAPPVDFQSIREVIEDEFKRPLEEIFPFFDPSPLASASIAQVHRARLPEGTEVAVKVQKPGVEEVILEDLAILEGLLRVADRLNFLEESVPLEELFLEFRKHLLRELDFLSEAQNMRRFRENFEGFPGIVIPRVFPRYSTRRVLTSELVEGLPLSHPNVSSLKEEDRQYFARQGIEAILKMIFEDGLFHADPHPGNIFLRLPERELVFLDFGTVGVIDRTTQEHMVRMLFALLEKDTERVVEILEEEFLLSPLPSPLAFRLDLSEVLERYVARDLQEIRFESVVQEFFYLARKYRLRFPPHFSLLLRALVVAEGTGLVLDPTFNVFPHLEGALKRIFTHSMRPERIAERLGEYALDWKEFLEHLPHRLDRLLAHTVSGKIRLQAESRDLEGMNRRLERMSTRLALSVILGSLLIGSSLIYTNYSQARVLGIFGILGFAIAAFFGIALVIEMLSHR
ncbi:MAG: AarF/ABC1/UbiB kinase family protein [Candidatus Caldatribacterium sp.]|nr:AarF/ABC1/UbiB kinase family protein [Candidatus Caldatribacterium sp.]